MFHAEALRFSLQALRANKVRTFLTALGLVIGNASVILVVTISITSRDYILDQIRGIGSNMIYAQYEAGNNTTAQVEADYVKLVRPRSGAEAAGVRIVAATGVMVNYDRIASAAARRTSRSSAPMSNIPRCATWCCWPGGSSTPTTSRSAEGGAC